MQTQLRSTSLRTLLCSGFNYRFSKDKTKPYQMWNAHEPSDWDLSNSLSTNTYKCAQVSSTPVTLPVVTTPMGGRKRSHAMVWLVPVTILVTNRLQLTQLNLFAKKWSPRSCATIALIQSGRELVAKWSHDVTGGRGQSASVCALPVYTDSVSCFVTS